MRPRSARGAQGAERERARVSQRDPAMQMQLDSISLPESEREPARHAMRYEFEYSPPAQSKPAGHSRQATPAVQDALW